MLLIPSELHPEVLSLFNESYIEGMDSVESATVAGDGIIEAITIDAGARLVARYDNGSVEIMQLDEATNTASFAAGKARSCKTGIPCGGTCISKGKTCKSKASASQNDKAANIETKAASKKSTPKKELSDSQKEARAVQVDASKKLPKGHPGEKAIADAHDYASAVAGSNDQEYYREVINHLGMSDESKGDFAQKFRALKEKENKKMTPTSPEQEKRRKEVLDTALKYGERIAKERIGGEKVKKQGFMDGIRSHLSGGENQRSINEQVLKLKPNKAKRVDNRSFEEMFPASGSSSKAKN